MPPSTALKRWSVTATKRSYQEAQGARTRTGLRERVRHAAIALTQRGLDPSASRIADPVRAGNVMRSRTARAAWREVLSDLGWDRPNIETPSGHGADRFNANDLTIRHLQHQHGWLAA